MTEAINSNDLHDTLPRVGQCCNTASRQLYGDCKYCGRKQFGLARRDAQTSQRWLGINKPDGNVQGKITAVTIV